MELPESVKNELMVCQQKLKGAVGLHQKLHNKMKTNPKDKRELKEKLINAQKLIKAIAKQQKPLVQMLRNDLDEYHQSLKLKNKPVDYEGDTRYIAHQLEQYRNQRNKSKSLLLPRDRNAPGPSGGGSKRRGHELPPTQSAPPEREIAKSKLQDDKPKSKFLLDRRSKLLSALDKVCKQNASAPAATAMSSRGTITASTPMAPVVAEKPSDSTRPPAADVNEGTGAMKETRIKTEPMPVDLTSSRPDTPSPVPEYGPDYYELVDIPESSLEPGSQEQYLRYLGIVTHEQCSQLVAKRSERKKRISVSTAKTEFYYSTPENTPKRKKKLYLQQHTPPMTRKRTSDIMHSESLENIDDIRSTKSDERESAVDGKQEQQSSVLEKSLPVVSIKTEILDKEDACIVCRLIDDEAVNRCEHCGEFYHPSCHGPGPLYIQTRFCPYCVRRSSSPETAKDKLRIKMEQKKQLLEINRNLKYEVQDLDLHASELAVKIKRQNFKRDQLLTDQRGIKSNLKILLDFVAQAKGQLTKIDS